jgi:hypothetical protein
MCHYQNKPQKHGLVTTTYSNKSLTPTTKTTEQNTPVCIRKRSSTLKRRHSFKTRRNLLMYLPRNHKKKKKIQTDKHSRGGGKGGKREGHLITLRDREGGGEKFGSLARWSEKGREEELGEG